MSSFLFTVWEGGGNVGPTLSLAYQLALRGHRVRVLADPASAADVAATGATFIAWQQAPHRADRSRATDLLRDWEAASPQEGFGRLLHGIMTGPALAYATELKNTLAREPADLVIASDMLFGVMAGCESIGQRYVIFAANLCLFPIEHMPLFGPCMPPPRDAAERALQAEIFEAAQGMFDSGLPALNAARRTLGLAALAHLTDQLRTCDALLLGTSRAFDYGLPATPAWIRYIGPQLDEPVQGDSWQPAGGDARPLVTVGFSTTFQNQASLLQTVMNALAALPVRGVVTRAGLEADELAAPANVTLLAHAPHDPLMRESAAVVTHGGHGTVMRALRQGKPLLVIPQGRDQSENAARVVAHGAGLVLPPTADAASVAASVQRLLTEPSFQRAAAALAAQLRAEAAGDPAVTELELAAAPRPARLAC